MCWVVKKAELLQYITICFEFYNSDIKYLFSMSAISWLKIHTAGLLKWADCLVPL